MSNILHSVQRLSCRYDLESIHSVKSGPLCALPSIMRKTSYLLFVLFLSQNVFSSTLKCESLIQESISEKKALSTEKDIVSERAQLLVNEVLALSKDSDLFLAVFEGRRPDWQNYQKLDSFIKKADQFTRLSSTDKAYIKKSLTPFIKQIESKQDLAQSQLPEISYKQFIDLNYSYFKMMTDFNQKIKVKVFPEIRSTLAESNEQTIEKGKALLKKLEEHFEQNFEETGFKNYDEFVKYVESKDKKSASLISAINEKIIVTLRRPENARFWLPMTGFQNQRTTGSSNGSNYGQSTAFHVDNGRNKAEANLSNYDIQDYVQQSVRFMPNYAEVTMDRLYYPKHAITDDASQYGSDLWVIKKQVIEERATWTPSDSLGPGWSVDAKLKRFIPWKYKGLMANFLTNSFPEFKPHDYATDYTDKQFWGDFYSFYGYIEAQIFGSLTLDHVAELRFRGNPPSAELAKLLKSKNIKIYDDRKYLRGTPPVIYEVD